MPPRIRRSKPALWFSTILSVVIMIVGISLAVASEQALLGSVLVLAGFVGLIGVAIGAKYASHPLITGLEIEDSGDGHAGTQETPADRLRELQGLREDGIISDEEFESKKAEILAEEW